VLEGAVDQFHPVESDEPDRENGGDKETESEKYSRSDAGLVQRFHGSPREEARGINKSTKPPPRGTLLSVSSFYPPVSACVG
jgi:hypothetical protein